MNDMSSSQKLLHHTNGVVTISRCVGSREVSFQDFLWNKCDKFWRINFKHWLYSSYELHWIQYICFPVTYQIQCLYRKNIKSTFIWLNAITDKYINSRPNIVFSKTFNNLQRTPSQTQCTVWVTFSTSFYINSDMNIQFLGNKTPGTRC